MVMSHYHFDTGFLSRDLDMWAVNSHVHEMFLPCAHWYGKCPRSLWSYPTCHILWTFLV